MALRGRVVVRSLGMLAVCERGRMELEVVEVERSK